MAFFGRLLQSPIESYSTFPNGFKAVHGIDLEVQDGEFMVLVGPPGCAKSTTLRMVAGLEEITGGKIWIGGFAAPPTTRGSPPCSTGNPGRCPAARCSGWPWEGP